MPMITIERETLGRALDALVYHQDQTRPIELTQVAIDGLRAALAAQPADALKDAVLALNSAWNARKPESEIADALDLCRRLAATPTAAATHQGGA